MTAPTQPAPLDLDALERLHQAATTGPWEPDCVRYDGCYGAGEDVQEGYIGRRMFGPEGQDLFDSGNSDAACIHEEMDEDGVYAWDEIAKRNFALIAAARNALPDLLAEARENRTSRDRISELERENAELREALRPFADLGEAHDEVWFEERDNSACFRIGPYRLEAGHLRRAARLVSEPHGAKATDHG